MPIPLSEKVVRLHRALSRARLEHAFGGALALAYYTVPRTTIDIDVNVFVGLDRLKAVGAVLVRLGVDRVPGEAAAGQFRSWWENNPVDVFLSYDEIHDAMRAAARTVPFGDTTIPILAPEHLMVAKIAFNRAKDWIDIEQMLTAVDDLDLTEVRRWLDHLVGSEDARVSRFEELTRELLGPSR